MAVDPAIEDFAFALFRKLWIGNGLPDYTEMVPDYPAVPDVVCPDDFCDTVYAFQCISSSFYEELCEEEYNVFAHSRSDFYHYLLMAVAAFRKLGFPFAHASLSLAVVTAEMGIACARRGNYVFIFSCPLAFAMVFEEAFRGKFESNGPQAAWGELFECGSRYSLTKQLAGIVGRSKFLRRDLIYRLNLLRIELHGNCPDDLSIKLEVAIKIGGCLDDLKLPLKLFSTKLYAALYFPVFLEAVYQEEFIIYLKLLYAENFIKRHDRLRKCFIEEIAKLCGINDEESKDAFIALYEESVFGDRVDSLRPDSSSAPDHQDLDPNCIVSQEEQGGNSSRPLDIFYELRMSDGHVTVDARASSASELKDQEVATDTSASEQEDHDISIGTTFELKDPEISDNMNASKVEDQGKFKNTNTSNLNDQEGVLDSGPFKLMDQGISMGTGASIIEDQEISSDTNGFDTTRNKVTGASKFNDEMVFSSDSSVSKDDAEGTTFGLELLELNSSKNITSPSEVCLMSKRVVETDNHANFETLNKNSSLSTSVDAEDRNEKSLLDDCQSPVFDIFTEEYLKLEKNETEFGDSNTLKLNDREVIDENCLKREEVFKEPVSSEPFPLQIKNIYSIKPPFEAFSKIESSLETSSTFSADSICTVISVETYSSKIPRNSENIFQLESKSRSELPREAVNIPLEFPTTEANLQQEVKEDIQQWESPIEEANAQLELTAEEFNTEHYDNENDGCKYQSVHIPLSPKPYRKDAKLISREKIDSDPKEEKANVISPQLQKSHTKDKQVKSSLTEGDCYKLIEGMSGTIIEDQEKSEKRNKKRENRLKKKNQQDTGKRTEGLTIMENGREESGITKSDVSDKKRKIRLKRKNQQDTGKETEGPSTMENRSEESEIIESDVSDKKRKNRLKRKNQQDTGKETEGPSTMENRSEESEIIESDVYQMILVMGVPFEKQPIKRDNRFMDFH